MNSSALTLDGLTDGISDILKPDGIQTFGYIFGGGDAMSLYLLGTGGVVGVSRGVRVIESLHSINRTTRPHNV